MRERMVTVTGDLQLPLSKLKALVAEAEQPHPVEGQVYRQKHTTDGDPYQGGGYNVRQFINGGWRCRSGDNKDWFVESEPSTSGRMFRLGELVPCALQPVFQVGQWVIANKPGDWPWEESAAKVSEASGPTHTGVDFGAATGVLYMLNDLMRHATPDEIAAATRIVPKVGMLLKRKSDGAVFRVYGNNDSNPPQWVHTERLVPPDHDGSCAIQLLEDVTTEAYDILDEFTLKGVR